MNQPDGPFTFEPRDAFAEPTFTVAGHTLRFVHHPEDRYDAIIRLINCAEKSIRAFYYMVTDDESGQGVVDALCAARERGVEVSFGIDSFGSDDTPTEWFDQLKDCGISFFCFSSRRSIRYLIRNHQKMLIIDGNVALISGYNIRDSYFWRGPERSWEDLGVIIEGDRVDALCRYYDEFKQIAYEGRAHLRDVRKLIQRWIDDDGPLQWRFGGPTSRLSPWALKLKRDLEAGTRASIVTAYFSPGRAMIRRISKLAKSPGPLKLVLAGKSDSRVTIGASRLLYRAFLKRGAEIYEFQPCCLHMKMLVIDDIVYIGSANLDPRSLYLNCEVMLRIESSEVADHMRDLVDHMAEQGEQQTRELVKARSGPLTTLGNALSYLIVGVIDYTVTRRLSFRFWRRLPDQDR